MAREIDRQQVRLMTAMAPVENEKQRGSARRVALQRLGNGRSEFGGAVVFQQAEQLTGLARERLTPLQRSGEKVFNVGHGVAETSNRSRAQCFSFLLHYGSDMSRVFKALMAVIRALMASQLRGPIEQAHQISVGHQGKGPAYRVGRNGIVV